VVQPTCAKSTRKKTGFSIVSSTNSIPLNIS
jgi:hypothetical protein